MVMMSVQPVALRCWRTIVRPLIGLLARRPVPLLRSEAVKVTMAPDLTLEAEAVIDIAVGMSRQVLYRVVQLATSYCCSSAATSHRAYAWAFQPALGLVREKVWTTASP